MQTINALEHKNLLYRVLVANKYSRLREMRKRYTRRDSSILKKEAYFEALTADGFHPPEPDGPDSKFPFRNVCKMDAKDFHSYLSTICPSDLKSLQQMEMWIKLGNYVEAFVLPRVGPAERITTLETLTTLATTCTTLIQLYMQELPLLNRTFKVLHPGHSSLQHRQIVLRILETGKRNSFTELRTSLRTAPALGASATQGTNDMFSKSYFEAFQVIEKVRRVIDKGVSLFSCLVPQTNSFPLSSTICKVLKNEMTESDALMAESTVEPPTPSALPNSPNPPTPSKSPKSPELPKSHKPSNKRVAQTSAHRKSARLLELGRLRTIASDPNYHSDSHSERGSGNNVQFNKSTISIPVKMRKILTVQEVTEIEIKRRNELCGNMATMMGKTVDENDSAFSKGKDANDVTFEGMESATERRIDLLEKVLNLLNHSSEPTNSNDYVTRLLNVTTKEGETEETEEQQEFNKLLEKAVDDGVFHMACLGGTDGSNSEEKFERGENYVCGDDAIPKQNPTFTCTALHTLSFNTHNIKNTQI